MADGDGILLPRDHGEWVAETLRQRAEYGGVEGFPARLFRYYSADAKHTLDNLRDILVQSRMRLNARSEFNDPFDSYSDWLTPNTKEELRQYFFDIAKGQGSSENEAALIANYTVNTDNFWQQFKDSIRGSIEKAGIACFAESGLNFLMWSHYGSQHTGAAIEFYGIANDEPIFPAMPVRYGDDFPRFKYNRADFNDQTFRSVLYKSSAWRYEMEWRLIESPHAKSYGALDARVVCSVTFGCLVKDEFKNKVLAIVDERKKAGLPDIQLYKAKLRDDAFALDREPVV